MEENKNNEQQKWSEILPIIVRNLLRRYKTIILVGLAAAFLSDIYLTWRYVPMYSCQATLAIKTNATANSQTGGEDTGEIANAFGYLISSNIFRNQMVENLQIDLTNSYFSCSTLSNTDIIQVSAISTKAKTSYDMMDYLIDHYQDVAQLVLGNVNVEVLQDKIAPTGPYNTLNHTKNLITYGGLAMIATAMLVSLFSYLKDTIKTKEDIQEKLQLSVFATVPMEKRYQGIRRKKSILMNSLSTSFQFVEVFKRMRVKIEESAKKHGYKVILVTSTLESEGKSSVAANLAIALASNNKKVLVIDGDLRKPSQYKVFQMAPENNLKFYLEGQQSLKDSITHDDKTNVDIILQKRNIPNILDALESEKMRDLFEEARKNYDYILVDTSPAGYFNDAVILAQYSDALLFVCKQDCATSEEIYDMISKMSMTQRRILGIVFNQKLRPLFTRNNNHYYHYGYSYGYYGSYGKKNND